ncbi:unnamed protein product (macronuclear) [Paramecium tetraurelia]|uniref:Uncharacterized protein n=1 Tax=Paramecium tetraurelia TaxID=5888 RepID=A0DP57_PARTE|nr:uncharacterized protein GSPATT00019006001 [Paramecium tetraurelia]CAK84824.1 unnamed protein product [Paramecium tetraurelia]|eukprot:XP_001452221.1 hypothetical protein (macronuclear) [Paramecium tetraurelia strain d4-2]
MDMLQINQFRLCHRAYIFYNVQFIHQLNIGSNRTMDQQRQSKIQKLSQIDHLLILTTNYQRNLMRKQRPFILRNQELNLLS